MKRLYSLPATLIFLLMISGSIASAQVPTSVGPGICSGIVADFTSGDNGYNSPSIYAGMFDSSFYYHSARGYWIDYLPPTRVGPPGAPRVLDIISPPYINPNPTGSFNVGFSYIVNNPLVDRFQVRIISVTTGPLGTTTNVEASSGLQFFSTWSTPVPYLQDIGPDPTAFLVGFQGNVCIRLIDPDITNMGNTTYRVEVAYIINEPVFAVIDNISIGPVNIPLPVDFIGLVADRDNNSNVNLRWDVSDEVNVSEYRVERSSDGSSFSFIGTVTANGKSVYAFTNYDVSSKTQFYRVKSVDNDGKFKYSGIIRLKGMNSFSDQMVIYPVPAKDEIMVEHGRMTQGARMVITSIDGKTVKTVLPASGSSHTPVNISDLRPGLYLLRLEDGVGDLKTAKLIKN